MTDIPAGTSRLSWPVRVLRWLASWMIVAVVIVVILLLVAVLQCAGLAIEIALAICLPLIAFFIRWRYGKQ